MKHLILLFSILLLPFTAIAQDDFCKGLADFDNDVDGTDAGMFRTHFGRSVFENPCPPNGPAPVPKTGQTTSYATGDDGDLERGIEKPPLKDRFTDNGDGTIQDNLTGLIWMQNANCFGQRTWSNVLSDCNGLADGMCGLTDDSIAGDWRLAHVKEQQSLMNFNQHSPALPSGHPFVNIQSDKYWSSTFYSGPSSTSYVWYINLASGYLNVDRAVPFYIWPVRCGH